MADFRRAVAEAPVILTDGGIETRIMFEAGIALDRPCGAAALLDDARGRTVLEGIYASYLDAAADLPIVIGTPTFRAQADRLAASGRSEADAVTLVNADAVAMHRALRAARPGAADRIFIAGVIGPKGDAFIAAEAPDAATAETYHRPQIAALAAAGADFLFAPTLPAQDEAIGVARAMAGTGLPYVLSFGLAPSGRLMDGHDLGEAIAAIDAATAEPPLYYLVNCIHASAAARALHHPRLFGVKANGSRLTPEELVALDRLDSEPPEVFALALRDLHARGARVLGGCCGTDQRHIAALAGLLRPPS